MLSSQSSWSLCKWERMKVQALSRLGSTTFLWITFCVLPRHHTNAFASTTACEWPICCALFHADKVHPPPLIRIAPSQHCQFLTHPLNWRNFFAAVLPCTYHFSRLSLPAFSFYFLVVFFFNPMHSSSTSWPNYKVSKCYNFVFDDHPLLLLLQNFPGTPSYLSRYIDEPPSIDSLCSINWHRISSPMIHNLLYNYACRCRPYVLFMLYLSWN